MSEPFDPIDEQPTPAAATPIVFTARTRLKTGDLARVGLIAGCLVAIVASAAVVSGVSPAATSNSVGAAPSTAATAGEQGPTTPTHRGLFGTGGGPGRIFGPGGLFGGGGAFGPSFGGGRGFGGDGRGGPGQGAGAISITKIAGSDVSLATADGWSRTITITDKTEIQVGSQKGALSDLKVGDTVNLRETKNTDGSYTVTLVVVRVPTIGGSVTGVTSSGFTLKKRDGSTATVTVTGSTTYLIAGTAGARADVTTGTDVTVEGVAGTGDAFTANVVHIAPAVRAGTVTATTADTITIKTRDGSSATIHVDSKTTFRVAGATTPGIADVKVGSIVLAQGTSRADGSLDAVSVFSGQLKAPHAADPKDATPSPPSG